jgi:uncharacterized membrane protein YesL
MTLLGGVVFGVLPATVVVAVMVRRYLNGVMNITAKDIFTQFKLEFVRANRTGWMLLLPILALVWWSGWLINNATNVGASLSLAMIPMAIGLSGLLFATLLQMSIYHNNRAALDIQNGLQFLIGQKTAFFAAIAVLLVSLLAAQLLPVLALFFYVSPAVLTAISLTWLSNEHLQEFK